MFNEKLFWNKYWQSRIGYFKRSGILFENRFRWGYYCNKALFRHYKNILGEIKNKDILEWGAGSGYVSCLAALEGASVTSIDYASKAVEYMNTVSKVLRVKSGIKIMKGDLQDIPGENYFDTIWNCGVLEHYSDEEIIRKLKMMIRLTKSNGIIICTLPNLKSPEGLYRMLKNFLMRSERRSERVLGFQHWTSLFQQAGFKQIKIVPVDLYAPSFIPGKLAYLISQIFPLAKKYPGLAWLFSIVGSVGK